MSSMPDHTLGEIEQAIGKAEQAITRQLLLLETPAATERDAIRARELMRVAQGHLADLHGTRRQLLDAWAG